MFLIIISELTQRLYHIQFLATYAKTFILWIINDNFLLNSILTLVSQPILLLLPTMKWKYFAVKLHKSLTWMNNIDKLSIVYFANNQVSDEIFKCKRCHHFSKINFDMNDLNLKFNWLNHPPCFLFTWFESTHNLVVKPKLENELWFASHKCII